jgi:hypothetical protein
MSTLTTRAGKGSPLTNNELDANFTNLNADKVEVGGDLSGTSSAPNVAKIQGRAVSTDAPAAGEKLVWSGTAWEPSVDPTGEPIGHADKTQSTISFDSSSRTFTIAPVASEFVVWCKGVKYTYTSAQTVVIPNTTGLHYIYFSSSGVLSTQMSFFSWAEHAPTAYIYWNATTSTAVYFGDERHGVVLDWQTHEYLHRTRGAAIANGFLASGYTLNNSATDAATQIAIESGTFFDEDMKIDIVSTATPTAGTYQQNLLFPAKIPVLHLQGTSWVMDAPTNFPFKQGTSRPQYNSVSGGVWSTTDVGNNQHATTWILATNNLTYPVIAIIGQSATDSQGEAEAFAFADLSLTGFPSVEFRPLYKLVYKASDVYANSVNAQLVSIVDLRSISAVGSVANSATDHGNLSGLSDDDHAQYLHVSEVRSPTQTVKNSFLPSQTSNTGKYLSTDGTNPSWVAIPSGSLDFTGDVTGTGTTGSPVALTLANSGVTTGTYSKVTVDAKGRVTSGANIASSDVTTALGFTPENVANKAIANGYASLDSSGKVPSNQLPSYVDDVIEVANYAALPGTGETGKIYITISDSKTYRWSGSAYVEITASPGSTDAVPEGSTNLYFTNARARAAVSASGSLSYSTLTGVFSYTQPTNVSTFTNDSGYLTGITGAQVTTALGYTPYNSTNPSGYITSSASITGTAAGITGYTLADVTGTATSVMTRNTSGDSAVGSRFHFTTCTADGGTFAIVGLNWGGTAGTYKNFEVYDYVNSRPMFKSFGETRNFEVYGALSAVGATLTSASTVSVSTWEKWTLETTGVTAKARQGSDTNGLNFTSNARWTGSAWAEDDTARKKFAYIQHLGNGRHEFRTSPTGAGVSWTTSLTVDESAVNSTVALQQGGNQVLHAGNYTSGYFKTINGSSITGTGDLTVSGTDSTKLPLTGGTLTGDLRIDSNWGVGAFNEQLIIYGTYPSMTFRSTTSDTGWLVHTQSDGGLTYYSIAGASTNNWTQQMTLLTNGELRKGGAGGNLYIHTGNVGTYALPISGGTLTGTITVGTTGSSSQARALRIVPTGTNPSSFSSYSGSWRSALEIWDNAATRMLFLAPPDGTNFNYSYIKSTDAGLLVDVGSGGGTRALTIEASGVVNAPQGLQSGGNNVITAANIGSYASGSAPLLSALSNYVWSASTLPTGYSQGIQCSFVYSGWQSYGSVMTMNTYSGGGGALQLYVPYSPTYGGTGLQARFGNYDVSSGNSWTSWKTLLASDNYGSYSTFGGKVTSGGNNGFANDVYYGGVRNPIWSFGNASSYGISYYQGAAGVGGNDTIGFSVNGTTSATSNNFAISNGASYVNNNVILHAGNYQDYSPTKTGGNASGTWGINITGSAGSATNATNATNGRYVYDNGTYSGGAAYREASSMHVYYASLGRTVYNNGAYSGSGWVEPSDLGVRYASSAGSAGSAIRLVYNDGPRDLSDRFPNSFTRTVNFDFVGAGTANGTGNYGGVMTYSPWTGTTASTGDSSYQLAFANNSGVNASGQPKLSIRNGIDTTWNAWYTLLHSGNYQDYSPTKTGGNASGTWPINITGNASTASTVSSLNGAIAILSGGGGATFGANHYSMGKDIANGSWSHPHYSDLIIGYHTGIRLGAAYSGIRFYANSPTTDANNDGNGDQGEALLMTVGGYALGGSVNIVNDCYAYGYRGHSNVAGTGQASYHPAGIYSVSTNWLYGTIYMNGNIISGCGNIYLDTNHGNSVVGLYSSYRYQGVFAMGDSYKMSADGTSLANMYGIAWSHPNTGGAAGNLTDHGMLIINNGSFRCAISNSIVASGNITAYSDERLKRNWRDMPENFVERLAQVKVGRYERIDDGMEQVGVSAQSLQPLLPEAIQVAKDEIGTLSVSYGNAAMASAVELAKELVQLKRELAELKSRLH